MVVLVLQVSRNDRRSIRGDLMSLTLSSSSDTVADGGPDDPEEDGDFKP